MYHSSTCLHTKFCSNQKNILWTDGQWDHKSTVRSRPINSSAAVSLYFNKNVQKCSKTAILHSLQKPEPMWSSLRSTLIIIPRPVAISLSNTADRGFTLQSAASSRRAARELSSERRSAPESCYWLLHPEPCLSSRERDPTNVIWPPFQPWQIFIILLLLLFLIPSVVKILSVKNGKKII